MPIKLQHHYLNYTLLFAIVLISRLPFLSAGYGVEEDSWGMINALQRMHANGVFEVSRFPGHPVLEMIYYFLLGRSYFLFNFCTALISSIGFVFFAAGLKELGFKNFFWPTIALAFIPVVYIKCTDTMDFTWGLGFMLVSFYFIVRSNLWIAGLALGIAIGARFTSVFFLVPLIFLFFDYRIKGAYKSLFIFLASTAAMALLCFLQTILNYNPKVYIVPYLIGYPDAIKTIYKLSIGVFGIFGCLVIAFLFLRTFIFKGPAKKQFVKYNKPLRLLPSFKIKLFMWSGLLLFSGLFLWQPHKSAYLIPALPFIVMLIEYYSRQRYSMFFALSMAVSCFFFGINLQDDFRGTKPSVISKTVTIASQKITIDLLNGPVLSNHSQRIQKMNFAKAVIQKVQPVNQPTLIVAGWWINELEVLSGNTKPAAVRYCYFADEAELKIEKQKGVSIYYLPQQDDVNDLRWQKKFTRQYAQPLFNDNGQHFLY